MMIVRWTVPLTTTTTTARVPGEPLAVTAHGHQVFTFFSIKEKIYKSSYFTCMFFLAYMDWLVNNNQGKIQVEYIIPMTRT